MGACCSVSWEHQEALAWYAQAGGKTCLSKNQIWTLVASFRAIREKGKRNAYAMKNAKQHYDPRRLTKEHLAEWIPAHASFKAESLMFRALMLAGNPSDGRAHLYPSEFCRMVERVCSVEGPDLARLVFDATARERIAGKRWISLKRVLKHHGSAMRRGQKRGAGVAVGDLALVMEFAEVLKHRVKRGMPVVLTTEPERERAAHCMTLREFLAACRRTPQILWPAQWIQRHFRQQFFGERWWNGLVRRSARLGLPPDDDALESAVGGDGDGDGGPGAAAAAPASPAEVDSHAAKAAALDPTTAARRALAAAGDDAAAAAARGPRSPFGSSARLNAANRTWAATGAEDGAAEPAGARRVRFAEGTKPGAEPGEGGGISSPRKDAAVDDADLLDGLSGDGVSSLTALVLAAERKRSGGEIAAARAEAARRRGETATAGGDGAAADSKQAALAGASLAVASATIDFAARLRRRAKVRRAKGFAAPARDVYSEVAAPGGAGIDAALGFSGSGSDGRLGSGASWGAEGRAGARGRGGRVDDGDDDDDDDDDDEPVELVGDDLSGLEAGGAAAQREAARAAAARSQKRLQARARRQKARVAAEAAAVEAAGQVRPVAGRKRRGLGSRGRSMHKGGGGGGEDAGGAEGEAGRRARARAALAAKAGGPGSGDPRRLPKTVSHSAAMARAARSAFPGLTRPPSTRDLPRVQSSTGALSPSSSSLATRSAFPPPSAKAAAESPDTSPSRAARKQAAGRRVDVSGSSGVSLVSMSRGGGGAAALTSASGSVAVRVLKRPVGRSGSRRRV